MFPTYVGIGIRNWPGNVATYIDLTSSKMIVSRDRTFSRKIMIFGSYIIFPWDLVIITGNWCIFDNAIFFIRNTMFYRSNIRLVWEPITFSTPSPPMISRRICPSPPGSARLESGITAIITEMFLWLKWHRLNMEKKVGLFMKI